MSLFRSHIAADLSGAGTATMPFYLPSMYRSTDSIVLGQLHNGIFQRHRVTRFRDIILDQVNAALSLGTR